MGRRGAAIAFVACAGVLSALAYLANNMYWGASINAAPGKGTIYLFHDPVAEPYGQWLWVSIKPLLGLAVVATAWALFRCVRVWGAARPAGVCRKCGYDLRASPERCPECGTAVTSVSNADARRHRA